MDSQQSVDIPQTRAKDAPLRETPLDVDGIARVLESCARRHLYTDIPVHELIATEDPKGEKRRGVQRITAFDKVLAYELRYRKGLRLSQVGLAGRLSVEKFQHVFEDMFLRELQACREEQPNCEWRLVACRIDQINTTAQSQVIEDRNPDIRIGIPADLDRPPAQSAGRGRVVQESDMTWHMPLVFADIAKAELGDPAGKNPDRMPMSEEQRNYLDTRQLRYLSPGQRRNRELAVALLEYFAKHQGKVVADREKVLGSRFTDEQRSIAQQLRTAGTPPAAIAKLMGISVQDLELLLGSGS